MNIIKSVIRAVLIVGLLAGNLFADPALQPNVSFTYGAGNTWNAVWEGVASRTYFAQGSQDLVAWEFLPVVEFGTGAKGVGVDTGGVSKYFFRLKYVDDPYVTSEQEARDADFDGDGIPNWLEVDQIGSNPLDKNSVGDDSDSDGIPDWWETKYNLDANDSSDATADLVGDGITNLTKYLLGRNPLVVALPDSSGVTGLEVHTHLE
jgi:hypothetical protein